MNASLRHAPTFSFGELFMTEHLLSRVYANALAVLLPESFRGGCSFGDAIMSHSLPQWALTTCNLGIGAFLSSRVILDFTARC